MQQTIKFFGALLIQPNRNLSCNERKNFFFLQLQNKKKTLKKKHKPLKKKEMCWEILIFVLTLLILFFVIWMFVKCMSTTPQKSLPKFFSTPSGEFASAYVDREHGQISLLGEKIPFQTVNTTGDQNQFTFEFTNTDGEKLDGHYADGVLHVFLGTHMLALQSSSPKDLMENVATVYKELNVKRALRL